MNRIRYVLIGDGFSPHLLKWAAALAVRRDVDLWVVSSRGFLPAFDRCVQPERRLALEAQTVHGGGNAGILKSLPRLGSWLRRIDPDWLHPHYLTSHGTLAWLGKRFFGLRAKIVGSAWGSDILLTPSKSALYRALTRRVLSVCSLTTSDSIYMAQRMQELGAKEVMTFPFGLDALPQQMGPKAPWRMFSNRALEPLYRPDWVLRQFEALARDCADAELIIAHDGTLRGALEAQAGAMSCATRIRFVGRLDPATQADWYATSQWYISLPETDSVSVSVLEAMAHGAIPLLSDLPANRELVNSGQNGLIVGNGDELTRERLSPLLSRAADIERANRSWVERHAIFGPCVERFLERLREIA